MNAQLQNSATLLLWEKPLVLSTSAVHKYRAPGRRGDYILWVLSKETALFIPSSAQNFYVASRYLENLCKPAVGMSLYGFGVDLYAVVI
jgi:hypothetical protein